MKSIRRILVGAALAAVLFAGIASACTLPTFGSGATMPTDVYGAAMATDGTYIYAAGGYSFGASATSTMFARYDPVANAWTSLAVLPQATSMGTLVYLPSSNKLYLFGGEEVAASTIYNTVYIYDIAGNSWSAGPTMPAVRAFMAGGLIGTKVYLAGGYDTGSVTPQPTTWEFDPVANTFTTKAPMTSALGGAAYVVAGGKLYVMGGRDATTPALTTAYSYDPVADAWATLAPLPTGVNVAGGAALTGNFTACVGSILVVGGGNPFRPSSKAFGTPRPLAPNTTTISQVYDIAGNAWTSGPSLTMARSFVSVGNTPQYVIAAGGYNGTTTTNTVERLVGSPTPVELLRFGAE